MKKGGKPQCHSCSHRAVKQSAPPARFLIFGCRELRLTFGLEQDFMAGKFLGTPEQKKSGKIADMPRTCKHFDDQSGKKGRKP